MNRTFQLVLALSLILFFPAKRGFTQDTEPAQAADAAETETSGGQEVEINEDNYRQFMELKDAMRQRTVLPENAYQSRAGLQKLDKLPEESQKHLRNQLREVIVEGDPWKPGDEGREYPFTPSEAAAADPALRKQETEAWGELVENYHAREADIQANASRTRAAAAAGSFESGSLSQQSGSKSAEGTGEDGGQQGGSPGQRQNEQEAGFSPNATDSSDASAAGGVSQNALEFLQQQGALGTHAQGSQTPGDQSAGEAAGQDGQQALAQGQGQQQVGGEQGQSAQQPQPQQTGAQQAGSQQSDTSQTGSGQDQQQVSAQAGNQQQTTSDESFQATPANSADEGVSQSALEFLMQQGGQGQAEQQSEGKDEGSAEQGKQSQGETEQQQQIAEQNEGQQESASGASFQDVSSESADEGVSQSALEFLMQQDGQDPEQSEQQAESSTEQSAQSEAEGDDQDKQPGAEQMQQIPAQDESQQQSISDTSFQVTEPDSTETSTEGVSQNALEFLMQQDSQDEQEAGNDNAEDDTLSIQDLVNASGTSDDAGDVAEDPDTTDPENPDETPPEKKAEGKGQSR